ncbi:biotin--[acetyl-CoA-carboxylase] ligase [Paenibacillus psychroresistens]|uniref:Bifunctional ligase/repressor BirA n=1 Tax=Paenibacillus psychroresistens TaxID=1778678 RepID=A0A6B8RK99_9BACL|nr:biotin--[acetyl-CoA-carboxylase] ligase [Paenibacillus psychroresistens]QGQ96841.1 biotin--[acetyl-CoA-carboxylase] ligase [Paenibacillus psychroresistens]
MNELILQYFQEHEGEYVSGEELSIKLQCSRTAVWKHIEALRKQGYVFDAIPRKGYKMLTKPVIINAAKLMQGLQTKTLGRVVRIYDEVDSTQNIAHTLVRQGAIEGTLVIAEQQNAGRGRMGRNWFSPKGKGIWMSLILKPTISMQFTPQLTLLVAVALCRAIQAHIPHQVGIKWPNDLLINGKKISGILLESSAEDERLNYVIAGIGISVNLLAEDYPEELKAKATSLFIEKGQLVDREQLICDFLLQLEVLLELYTQQGFAPIRSLWEALTISLHKPLRIQTAKGWVEGVANAIDEMGALWVTLPNGENIKLYSGDIELLL